MTLRKFLIPIVLIMLVMLVALLPAVMLAQESTEEPTLVATDPAPEVTPVVTDEPVETPPPVEEPPEETPVTEPQELLGLLFSLLKDATFIAWAAPGVVIVVGLLKTIFKFSGTVAVFITLVIQVAVWGGYAVANYFGAGEAFQKGYLIFVDIGRSLLPLVGSIVAGQLIYKASAKRNVPVLGYRVPDKPKQMKYDAPPGQTWGTAERESRTDRP